MKKTFTRFLAALALLAFFIPSMIAVGQTRADVLYSTCRFGSSYNSSNSSYTGTFTVTNGSFTWTVGNGNNNNNGWTNGDGYGQVKFGRKNNASVGYITTDDAYSGAVNKVEVTIDGLTDSKINSIKLYTSGDNSTWTEAGSFTKATGTQSVSIASPASNLYYKVEFDCASGSSNGLITVSKVEYYIAGATPTCAEPTFSPAAGAYTSAQNVTISTTTSGATIYYTTDGSDPTTSSSVYSSAITVSSNMTIKAMAAATGYDNSTIASASYIILDHAGTAADPYTIADAYTAIDANVGLSEVYVAGIISQVDSYNSNYHSITYWISSDGTTTSDQLEVYSGKGLNNTDFTSTDDVEVGAEVVVYGTLKKFNNTYEFDKNNYLTSYTAPQHDVATPTFSPVAGVYASAQSVTISCETTGASIYYTTNGSDPDANSTLYNGTALSISSTTTIKAIAYLAGVNSNIATATYYFCSAENPYTVTEALAFESYQYPANGIYVTGIVSTAATSLSSGTLTYYISVDGTTTADELEVYKGKDLNNASFTAVDDIQVGDIVTIYGNVQVYNSTIEFGSGNYLVSFERPVVPVINASDVNLAYDATSGEIEYEIENTPTGTSLTAATTTADWISSINITSEKVTFTCTANDGTTDRTATFTLSYTGAASKTVTVTQGHYTVDYATLPFVWAGGVKADLIALNGVTSNGLGGDYAESHGVYRVKFDNTGDYIQVKTNEQPGIVTIGVKMIGGNTTSHIYVKGSADGETFDDGESLEISGSANDVVNLTSTRSFDATVRYVQLYFDKGANVGVGPITIAQVTNDPFITVADATVNNVPAAGDNGTLTITYGYLDISDMSDFGVQFYDAEGEEESEPDWVEVLVAEEQTGEYVVSYVVDANSGAARTAYCKVFALGDTDYVYSNLITISQVEYVDTEDYELYSGALVEGDYVIYYNGYAMKNEVISNRLSYKTVTPNSNVIAADASIVWHIAPSATEGYWTIYSADAEAYAASTGANNKAQMLAELNNDNNNMALWSVTVAESKDNTYEFVNKYNYDNNANSTLRNNGTYGFACYANTTGGTLSLYKKVESFTLPIAQYTSGQNDGWYLIASPVAYTLAGQDMVSGTDYDLYRFNPTAEKEWENYKAHSATDFTTLEVGRGYLYANANDITLSFTGVPSSNGVVELTYETGHTFTGWNLIGNPLGVTANVDKDYYRINDTHTGIMTEASSGNVAVMEGIFVKATAANQTVTFTAASKGVRSNDTESVTLNVMRNDNVIDRAIVRFNSDRQLGKLTLFDDDTKIYIPQSDGDYAIVSSNGQGTMPVNFKAKEMGKYTISVETEGIDLSYLHLIDRLTGEDVNLLLDSEYSFIASNSDMESRFILSFGENGINASNETFAFQNGSEIIVNGEGELQIFDVTGRMVKNTVINGVEAITMPQGVYIFRLNEKVQKIVVR